VSKQPLKREEDKVEAILNEAWKKAEDSQMEKGNEVDNHEQKKRDNLSLNSLNQNGMKERLAGR